ncbi:MAG: arginine deiminase family protein [Thaumarchaeota archaeon]|nr:arginine deiminase family protein [Nitrososphaerota archaeon]
MTAKIRAEWDRLHRVAVHRPGIEMWFGLLAPYASLYERAFNRYEARNEHERLEYTLKHEFKVEVIRLKEKVLELADRRPEVRAQLVHAALAEMEFVGNKAEVTQARRELVDNTDVFDPGHFFNILLLQPKLDLEEGVGARAVHVNVTERTPLANLYFMRDQQAVTDRGIFVSRMSKPQRRKETSLTRLLWESLGEKVVHEVEAPGTFEGGDFIPMKDFALVGTGDRSNADGVKQMLEHGLDFDEVGVVHQPSHPLIPGEERDPMVDMHLDTYFNVAGSGVVVGSELLLKRAKVDVYHRAGKSKYVQDKKAGTTLHEFVKRKGFEIVNLTTLEQLSYASNFLCIKDGTILAIEVDRIVKKVLAGLEKEAKQSPERYNRLFEQAKKDYQELKGSAQFFPNKKELYQYGVDAYPIALTNLTGGYGGGHCMTAALERS